MQLPGRIGKQCRERWFNHLDPCIRKGGWSTDEDRILYEAQKQFGNRLFIIKTSFITVLKQQKNNLSYNIDGVK